MRQATIEETAADPEYFVAIVEAAETVTIVRDGEPVVGMFPVTGDETD